MGRTLGCGASECLHDEFSGVSAESSAKMAYVESLIADAQGLRKQHENLVAGLKLSLP